jgi:4,5-dihydroxyphthalate decarboxylase
VSFLTSAPLRLTYAGGLYDRTAPLATGEVRPEGIDLNFIPVVPPEAFWRQLRFTEFDVSELSCANYFTLLSRGDRRFIAIPVYPSRTFRHRCIFVNTASGVEKPEDLKGKRVGVPEYTMTAAVWLRGLLQHEYGVAPEEIRWFQGGEEQPGRKDRVDFDLPAGIRLEVIQQDRTLNEMIESGEIDVLMSPRMPHCFLRGSPRVRRLFPDFKRVEMDYFRRTGIFPIMHGIAICMELYEKHPWVAQNLFKAFCEAKELCFGQIYDTNVLRRSLPWEAAEYEETAQLMGRDYWPYGFAANRDNLETLHSYLLEQGLINEGGTIIGIASIAGIAGNNGQTNYASAKAGVIGWIQSLSKRVADRGITANVIAPGFMETEMVKTIPLGIREAGRRMNSMSQGGLPIDVAETIAWLASPGSATVSGNVIGVNGQMLIGAS